MNKIIQSGLFLFSLLFLTSGIYAQFETSYKLSTEGIKPVSLLLMDNRPLLKIDSLMYHSPLGLSLSYKINQLDRQFRMNEKKEYPAMPVNLGTLYYLGKPGTDFKTHFDNLAIAYEGYRWKFTFEHGYFGPALAPTSGRTIRKSIYQDVLYPWQNAPQSKYADYKSLYLITNFVYPLY